MRILIMVLSSKKEPYFTLMKAQHDTWDSIQIPDVDVAYYSGGAVKDWKDELGFSADSFSVDLNFKITDDYYFMAGKFKRALESVALFQYDLIFRTNSSSYVNKKRLKEFAATLPKEKLYAGWTVVDSNDDGGDCVSGAGIFLSPDTAEILRQEIDPSVEKEEDVYIGRILRKHGIKAIDDKSRFDYPQDQGVIEKINAPEPYHIRFKTDDRYQDANNMRLVHKSIINQIINQDA